MISWTRSPATDSAKSFTYANCIAMSSSGDHSVPSERRTAAVSREVWTMSVVDIEAKNDTASDSYGAAWRYFVYEKESDGNLEACKAKVKIEIYPPKNMQNTYKVKSICSK